MAVSLFSMVSRGRIAEILSNLQAFTGLSILLLDGAGEVLLSYGPQAPCCARLQGSALDAGACTRCHIRAGQTAQALGEGYIFSCCGGLGNIAFPLIHQEELLGCVLIGPFLMEPPDCAMVSELAEQYGLGAGASLELYDDLQTLTVMEPARVSQLRTLVDHLLSPLLPGERALLLHTQEKMSQQARLNETIQVYKEQKPDQSLEYFNKKEKDLLAKVRSGTVTEVKALLNELIGHVLFSEGGRLETVRIRAIELTTLLSRVAIDGGARTDSIYRLNSQFLAKLYREQDLEDLCILMQEVLESFMNAMFSESDKGNPYIRRALRFMADNYSEHLELRQVAEYVDLSPSYFSALFHRVVGVSFREHLNRIRVEESKRLLLSRKYSLADIAVSMGFPDQSYYSKVFKRIVGVTPGKFRP